MPESSIDELLARGQAALAVGELPQARAAFLQATQQSPKSAEAWHSLAMVQMRLDENRAAIGSAAMATEIAPNELLYWTALSQAFVRDGQIGPAEDAKAKARILSLGGKIVKEAPEHAE